MSKNTLHSQLWFNRVLADACWTLLATACWLAVGWQGALLTFVCLALLALVGHINRDGLLSLACKLFAIIQIATATLVLIAGHEG